MATSNRLLNFKNINREKYEYLEPEKSESGSYVSSCVYNLDGETKLGYYFECPRVVSPSGIYKSGGRYMMDVVIPLGSSLLEYLLSEDEMNMKATTMNSEDWFGEHFPLEVVQEKYNSALVFQNGNPILKLCIPTYQGKPMCEVFDNSRNLVTHTNVKGGSEVALILEKVGLRFLKETFVGEYTAHKIKIFSNQKLNQLPSGYLFGEEEQINETQEQELELENGEEQELEVESGEEQELEVEEEESEVSDEELLSEDESEFGDQLTDEELELEFSEDEGLTSEGECELEEKDEELEQDLKNMENELQEFDLNDNLVTAEGGESEELETDDDLEFNPAELTDEELEFDFSEESESEEGDKFNPDELTEDELDFEEEQLDNQQEEQLDNQQEELLNSPELYLDLEEKIINAEEIIDNNELELSPILDVELEEQDLQSEIREDVNNKLNSMNVEELKDEDLELEMSLS